MLAFVIQTPTLTALSISHKTASIYMYLIVALSISRHDKAEVQYTEVTCFFSVCSG